MTALNSNTQMVKTNQTIGGIILILVCLFSVVSAQTEVADLNISEFLRESILKTNQANFRLVSDYTYKMRRSLNFQDGKITSKLSEIYFPSRLKKQVENKGVTILLEENGIALSAKEVEKQRRKAGENLEKAERQSEQKSILLEQKRETGLGIEWTFRVTVRLTTFLEACQFKTPLQETVDGRKAISLNFDECNIGKLPETKSYLAYIQGKVLFDVEDKVPIRLEAWRKTPFSPANAQVSSKVLVYFAQKRVAQGVWFPDLIRVEGIGNEVVFPNLKANWQIEFFDYKFLETEIKDVQINSKSS